jgi:hypothetical protein
MRDRESRAVPEGSPRNLECVVPYNGPLTVDSRAASYLGDRLTRPNATLQGHDAVIDRVKRSPMSGFSLAKIIYQQVTGVLGAFALAALLAQAIDLEWRSFLGVLLGQWDEYVRPTVKWLLDLIVTKPLRFVCGFRLEIPILVRDYLSVGFILFTSIIRTALVHPDFRGTTGDKDVDRDETIQATLLYFAMAMTVWPILILLVVRLATTDRDGNRAYFWLTLTPVFYLGILLALNYLVL